MSMFTFVQAIRAVLKLLQAGIKWAAKHCLQEAASHCQNLWKHPKQAFECGVSYIFTFIRIFPSFAVALLVF